MRDEIDWLTSINQFKYQFHEDCKIFIEEFGDQGTRFKHRLHYYCVKGGVDFYELRHLHCRDREKNCGMQALWWQLSMTKSTNL